MLVGTKKDILADKKELENLKQGVVNSEDVKKMAKKISAFASLECSAFTGEGVEEVFLAAVRAAVEGENSGSSGGCCALC